MSATSSGSQTPLSRGSDSLIDSAPNQVSPGLGRARLRVWTGFLEVRDLPLWWERGLVPLFNKLPQFLTADPTS